MCGLAGFLSAGSCTPGSASYLLNGMSANLVHRGPDGCGQWLDSDLGVGLCHRRLAILDLSTAGQQPMASACGRWQMVFNGEIYNHLDLRQQLEQAGLAPIWRGHSDTETLLAALSAWGVTSTLPRLNGMFAFALWDRQHSQLVLARDRFGEKPLYYAIARNVQDQPLLLFGSELQSLMVHPGYDRTIDRHSTALYFRHSYIPAPWSIHLQTRKLSPGCSLTITSGDLIQGIISLQQRERSYWSAFVEAQQALDKPFEGSPEQAVDAVEEALSRSIARQSLADVPLGAFLSGGIDSSLVVSLLQRQSIRPIQSFSIGFDDPEFNEAPYAAAVARYLGTDHTEMIVSGADALSVIPQLPSIYSEPFADSSQIPTVLVSRLARQHVTVSLSGDAGDELFGGYNRYVFANALWSKLHCIPRRFRRGVANLMQGIPASYWQRILEPANRLLPASKKQRNVGERLHKVSAFLASRTPQELYVSLVSQWLKTDGLVVGAQEHQSPVLDPALWLEGAGLENQMMLLDTLTYLPDDILVKVDRAAMSASLETRVPMLDPELFTLAWSLPVHQKIASGRGKLPLRALLSRYLPEALIERPKMGFGVPLATWLREELRDWGESMLDPYRLRKQGLLEVAPIQECWKSHQENRSELHYQLWPVLILQAWIDNVERLPLLSHSV